MTTRALVLRAPGINCDRETAAACRLVGFETDLLHINQLLKAPERLLNYALLVFPGGFSYGDDLGAGTLLARNLTIHLGPQLGQFIDEGRLVLGICNGFQVLVRAGLLPGPAINTIASDPYSEPIGAAHPGDDKAPLADAQEGTISRRGGGGAEVEWGPLWPPVDEGMMGVSIQGTGRGRPQGPPPPSTQPPPLRDIVTSPGASLTDNASAQFECRWITLSVEPSNCIFTRGIEHCIELPVAHGEGQFVLAEGADQLEQLHANGQVALVFRSPQGQNISYPDNPNGSIGNIAGICNAQGNVFGLMPHPERYVTAMQHPQRKGTLEGQGDGLLVFKNAYNYARTLGPTTHARPPRELDAGDALVRGRDTPGSYAASGVDIAAADATKALMQDAVRATHGSAVLAGMGAFAGVLDASSIKQMRQPALVASTDGVGTKTLIAAQAQRFDTIGYDLVNHCVNDLLTQGAKPLFFMDYLAMGKLDALQAAAIVRGVAGACREIGCALLGGETAEMPDVYLAGAFDMAGTIVGVVERDAIISGAAIGAGNVLLGLSSSGLHTNGYSLARRVFAAYDLNTVFAELEEPLVDALLRPHRCYLSEIQLLQKLSCSIKGMAHITGGGFEGNIGRILPKGIGAVIETQSWNVPPLFSLLARLGDVPRAEMYSTLNMGIGMVLIFSAEEAEHARSVLPELVPVGYTTTGDGVVLRYY